MNLSFSRRSLPSFAILACAAVVAAQSPPAPTPSATPQQPVETAPPKPAEPKPWRLTRALGTPDWFTVSGSERIRYETLDNQFRFRSPNSNPPGQGYGDAEDVLAVQTLLKVEAKGERFGGAVEILDARHYGTDDTGFVDTSMVDAADVLQAYVDGNLGELAGGEHRLRVGRQTSDLGSRRVMARNAHRNTINSFTGVDWEWSTKESLLRAFWMLPVDRRPNDFASLQDNDWEENDQDLDLQFAGLFFSTKLDERTTVETYVLGLDERGRTTRRRSLLTPGLRLWQPRKKGAFHYELELIGQFGESKTATTATSPLRDHLAGFAKATLGYTLDHAWQPTVEVSYDYASGDQDPNDGENERFDTLFGARRWEYGPTGVFGAVARANLNSPELRLVAKPSKSVELTFGVRGVWLASERDAWTASGLRDATGRSGDDIGQQYEARLRWDLLPKSLQIDIGAVYLAEGSFQDRASRDQGRDTTFAYVQCQWWF